MIEPVPTENMKDGYSEKSIIIKENNKTLTFSLSDSLDDIKIAIFSRTGQNIEIEKASWKVSSNIYDEIRDLMNKHNATFSMVTGEENNIKLFSVHMKTDDNWFLTRYAELKGKYYCHDYFEVYSTISEVLGKYYLSDT